MRSYRTVLKMVEEEKLVTEVYRQCDVCGEKEGIPIHGIGKDFDVCPDCFNEIKGQYEKYLKETML